MNEATKVNDPSLIESAYKKVQEILRVNWPEGTFKLIPRGDSYTDFSIHIIYSDGPEMWRVSVKLAREIFGTTFFVHRVISPESIRQACFVLGLGAYLPALDEQRISAFYMRKELPFAPLPEIYR